MRNGEAAHLQLKSGARYHPPLGQTQPQGAKTKLQVGSGGSRWRWRKPIFTFVDLFAGIGGFRLGFERAGGDCVFSSEWDSKAQVTYLSNFGEMPHGDITKIDASEIPQHDILVAGFPCQPFSIAGVSKKNALGRDHGFDDVTQGALFFEIVRILAYHSPTAFVLENVKNLRSHDGGQTYQTIIENLRRLGYHVFDHVIDARHFVPQHRERIFIVGFRDFRSFDFPECSKAGPVLSSVLEEKVPDKYFLTTHLWDYLRRYAEKHRAKGNGFGCTLTPKSGVARTLSARYYKDGSEILIEEGRSTPRRLTPRECARLMGFPEDFKITVADTSAYKQFGNAVVVPVAQAVASAVVDALGMRPRGSHRTRSGAALLQSARARRLHAQEALRRDVADPRSREPGHGATRPEPVAPRKSNRVAPAPAAARPS